MSINMGKVGVVPNWIEDNDWSYKARLNWISDIMTFSPRDWRVNDYATPGQPDPEKWALYILAVDETKEEAIESWNRFCKDYETRGER